MTRLHRRHARSLATSAVVSRAAPDARATPAERRLIIDAVKGLLVLAMVLYHWLNYFVTTDGAVYKYLRFVSPSFIFVTGFLITNIYLTKYAARSTKLHTRLFVRGLKLVSLFTLLNLVAGLVVPANRGALLGVATLISNASAIYLSGDAPGVAFEVLVPIGYLLAASSVIALVAGLQRAPVLCLWLASVTSVYALKWIGAESPNVELLSMGLLGMVIGTFPLSTIDWIASRGLPWVGAYSMYLVLLTVYNVIYELQIVGLILNMVLIYLMAKRLGETGTIATTIILLGQYSLLAYIAQIAILRALAGGLRPLDLGAATYALSLTIGLFLMCLTIALSRWARNRIPLADTIYRAVFA